MDLQLQGETAVIVGGARGLGLAIARTFAREGANVAIIDRDPNSAAVATELAGPAKVDTLGCAADVADYAAISDAADQIFQRWSRCDHVAYAAAIGSGKYGFPFWNLSPADWPRVLEVNLLGAVHTAHALAPRMAEARRGTLLFIASVAGQMGSQTDPPYSASKAAIINFAQCAAKDLAPYGVRVNALSPGMIKTALNRSVWTAWNSQQPPSSQRSYEDWADDKVRRTVPLARWQDEDDVAEMAVFLASPRAKNITGQTLNVDGGQIMHS